MLAWHRAPPQQLGSISLFACVTGQTAFTYAQNQTACDATPIHYDAFARGMRRAGLLYPHEEDETVRTRAVPVRIDPAPRVP